MLSATIPTVTSTTESTSTTHTQSGDDPPTTDDPSVLVVSQLFPPESMAGAHRWEMFLRNVDEDVEARVVCPQPSVPVGEFERRSELWSTERVNGVPVTRLFTYQPTADRTDLERILNHVVFALLATVYVLVRGREYDCVVVQIGPHTTLVPGLAAMALGRGLVVDVYDRWLDNAVDFGFTDERSIPYRLLRWMERVAVGRGDHLIALTPTMADHYRSRYDIADEDVTVVPFGVDDERFTPAAADESAAGDEETARRIIYTGKFGEGQAFEPFLRGFRRVDDDCELVLYGFGERRDELEALVSRLDLTDRVRIADPVPREAIPSLVASSAISLVPLKTERTLEYARPTKFLETMAVGTPYVASAVTEIDAVTQESNAGLAVENDPGAIATALRTLLSDPAKRRAMGDRGVAFIDENHRWDELGVEISTVLSTVAADRSRTGFVDRVRTRVRDVAAAVASRL